MKKTTNYQIRKAKQENKTISNYLVNIIRRQIADGKEAVLMPRESFEYLYGVNIKEYDKNKGLLYYFGKRLELY